MSRSSRTRRKKRRRRRSWSWVMDKVEGVAAWAGNSEFHVLDSRLGG
jgi:hypothetical protein